MTEASLTTSDGERLEAIHDTAIDTKGLVVVCHPHPQHGGTMHAPMLREIAKYAVTQGFDVLRFNFRGVGASTGTHDNGHAELRDIDAAMAYSKDLDLPIAGAAGWSFGAAALLKWQAQAESRTPYVGIAPPVNNPLSPELPGPSDLQMARRRFIIGERDQFIDADELEAYAVSISAETVRYRGTDHFFLLKHKRLAEDVVTLMDRSIH